MFSALLGAVLLVMIGALFAADQSQARAGRTRARIDAADLSIALEQLISARIADLQSVRGAFLVGDASASDSAWRLVAAEAMQGAQGVRSLWITNAGGRMVYDTVLHAGPPAPPTPADLASLSVDAMTRREPVITLGGRARTAGSSRDVVMVVPVHLGEAIVGAVGATFSPAALLAPVVEQAEAIEEVTVVLVGRDTLATSPPLEGRTMSAAHVRDVPLPGGAIWQVSVRTTADAQGTRIALWALGLVAVVFLGVGVVRERRQAIRVSERSAELERLSTELLRANRMKSEFLANVSHELRTPLNAIVGFVDLLREGVYGELSPRQIPPVDRIAASATHLRHLVDQVLDIAKIAAGRLEVHPEVIALRPFVLNVASELESLISERELNLSIAVPATLPRVRTDPGHLRQILVNLIGNAVKYTPAGGVAVRARLVNGAATAKADRLSPQDPALSARSPDASRTWVALQVIDTGIGVAPADQERIFDEFEQVDAGPRGESMQRGTGLGLAISRRLARLLGGDITLDSQLGKGSTFTVWIPAHLSDLDSPAPEPTADSEAHPSLSA